MGERSEPALTTPTLANTPTFHIHKLLEVVATLHADRSSIPNNAQCLPHGNNYHGNIFPVLTMERF